MEFDGALAGMTILTTIITCGLTLLIGTLCYLLWTAYARRKRARESLWGFGARPVQLDPAADPRAIELNPRTTQSIRTMSTEVEGFRRAEARS